MSSIRSRLMHPYIRLMIRRPFEKVASSVEDCRTMMRAVEKYSTPPKGTIVDPVEIAGRPAEWVSAPGASTERAILYFHGGGCMMGSPANVRDMVARISRSAGVRALSLDYRLAPEHPFPAAVDDATSAYQWLLERGMGSESIVMGGDSAGGGLAYQTLATLQQRGTPLPAGAFFISPQTDFLNYDGDSYRTRATVDPYMTGEMARSISSHYARGASGDLSLLCLEEADFEGFPPLLVQVGDHELLLSDAIRLHDAAKAAGVDVTLEVWEGMWHVFQTFAGFVPESRRAIEKIGSFIRDRLAVS